MKKEILRDLGIVVLGLTVGLGTGCKKPESFEKISYQKVTLNQLSENPNLYNNKYIEVAATPSSSEGQNIIFGYDINHSRFGVMIGEKDPNRVFCLTDKVSTEKVLVAEILVKTEISDLDPDSIIVKGRFMENGPYGNKQLKLHWMGAEGYNVNFLEEKRI